MDQTQTTHINTPNVREFTSHIISVYADYVYCLFENLTL